MSDSREVLTQLVISEAQQRDIDSCLATLREETGATSALLIERSGLLLSTSGSGSLNDLPVASLVAGLFKSLNALTAILGETEVETLQHRGDRHLMLLCLLQSRDMLAVLLPTSATPETFEAPLDRATRLLTPTLIAARESTKAQPFSFSKDKISVFLGRL